MSLILPNVAAVIPVLPHIVDDVQAMARDKYLDSLKLAALVEKTASVHMRPIHDLAKPFVRKDAQGGHSYYLLWGHPVKEHTKDPRFMTAIEFRLRDNAQGKKIYMPEAVLRGPLANTVIVGGMECCGALQAHWTQAHGDGTYGDYAMVPIAGIIDPEHDRWLKGKIFVANDPHSQHQLAHLYLDILAHRYPEQFKHDCSSQASYADMKKGAAAAAPAVS